MERVALPMGIKIYHDQNNDLHAISSAMGTVKHIRCSPEVITLLRYVQTPQTVQTVYDNLRQSYPSLCIEDLTVLLFRLAEEGIVRINDLPSEIASSSFALFIEELAPSQVKHVIETLHKSTAIIIGVGTVGAAVATQLTQCQIAQLILIDADIVEESNLERQFAYSRNNIGVPKVLALQDFRLSRTHVQVLPVMKKIACSDGLEEVLRPLNNPSVIINCADSPSVDYVAACIAEAVQHTTFPFIAGGGYTGHLGSIGPTFIPGQSICWACYQRQIEEARQIHNINQWQLIASRPFISTSKHPAFGPLGLLISSLMATEALWLLTGLKEPLFLNRHGEWDLSHGTLLWHELKAREDCLQCHS